LVLVEGGAGEGIKTLALVLVDIACARAHGIEIARGAGRDRRHRLLVDAVEQRRFLRRPAARALGSARWKETGALQEKPREQEVVGRPHVDPLAELLLHEAARRMIGVPAAHAQAALQRLEART